MRDPGLALNVLDALPPEVLRADARSLHEVLPGPTLVHLPGRRPEPLFVSVLLHGNETSGLRAIQQVLGAHSGQMLPRALSIFFGNIAAARAGRRRLESQPDYNRVWPGGVLPADDGQARNLQRLFAEVLEAMRLRKVFASIDLHNTTGHNPLYCCVTELDVPHLQLAALFSRTVVHFRRPEGTQTSAFSKHCPAVACECGQAADPQGAARAAEFVSAVLHLAEIPAQPVRSGDVHLFHTVATVRVKEGVSFSFDGSPAALRFGAELEWFNFRELAPGTALALCAQDAAACLDVRDENDRDVGAQFLARNGDRIELVRSVMPAMLTRDARAVRQDCLCYFMERVEWGQTPARVRPPFG
jgi:succinylglutamate desuccinylase